jgi:hypothetical protein
VLVYLKEEVKMFQTPLCLALRSKKGEKEKKRKKKKKKTVMVEGKFSLDL